MLRSGPPHHFAAPQLDPQTFHRSNVQPNGSKPKLSDIETCPDCGGTLRVIACIEDPPLMAKILGHVRSREAGETAEVRAPPADSQQVPKLL